MKTVTVTFDPTTHTIVPLVLTEKMHAAAVRTIVRCNGNDDFPPRVFRAILAAAPRASATEPLTEDEKRRLNPYKYSHGAQSIWRNGFGAAEKAYGIGQDTTAAEQAFGLPAGSAVMGIGEVQ